MPLLILASAVSASASTDDITIIGERLRRLRFSIDQDRKSGALSCRVLRKSGDALMDASVCDEAKACVGQNGGRIPDVPALKTCLRTRFEATRQARAEGAR